jgi:hypothetical protein
MYSRISGIKSFESVFTSALLIGLPAIIILICSNFTEIIFPSSQDGPSVMKDKIWRDLGDSLFRGSCGLQSIRRTFLEDI